MYYEVSIFGVNGSISQVSNLLKVTALFGSFVPTLCINTNYQYCHTRVISLLFNAEKINKVRLGISSHGLFLLLYSFYAFLLT